MPDLLSQIDSIQNGVRKMDFWLNMGAATMFITHNVECS
jgi:hypothetical protein